MDTTVPQAPLDELAFAITELLASGKTLPGLILLYSAIDIFASLARPASKASVTRDDFIHWVETYMLPGSGLACTAIDLYAARCSLVHTYTAESSLSRDRKARPIQYDQWGKDSLQDLITEAGMTNTDVGVPVEKLFNAFLNATERFEFDISSDPKRQKLVDRRVQQFYRTVADDHCESRLALLKRVKAHSMTVTSLSEFILESAPHETIFVEYRELNGDLFYLLLGPAKSSGDTVSWVAPVGNEALHAAEILKTIQTRLTEANHRVKYIDLKKSPKEA